MTREEATAKAKAYSGNVIRALAALLHAANDLAPEDGPDKYDAWRALVMRAREEYDALLRLRALDASSPAPAAPTPHEAAWLRHQIKRALLHLVPGPKASSVCGAGEHATHNDCQGEVRRLLVAADATAPEDVPAPAGTLWVPGEPAPRDRADGPGHDPHGEGMRLTITFGSGGAPEGTTAATGPDTKGGPEIIATIEDCCCPMMGSLHARRASCLPYCGDCHAYLCRRCGGIVYANWESMPHSATHGRCSCPDMQSLSNRPLAEPASSPQSSDGAGGEP